MRLFRLQLGKLASFLNVLRYRLRIVTSARKFRLVEHNHRTSFNLLRQELSVFRQHCPNVYLEDTSFERPIILRFDLRPD